MNCKICGRVMDDGDECHGCWEVSRRLDDYASHRAGRRKMLLALASFETDEAPAAAPDECKRELLPLWQRSRDEHHREVFTRGAPATARVVVRWHPAVGFIPSVDGRDGCHSATSSAAMRDADTMAAAEGYELTADDMRLDEDLAYEVSGLEFNLDAEGFEPRLSGLGGLSFQRFAVMSFLAPDVRNSAMARVLRAHGAIVTEVER